jgi:Flp pilus assembly pilin Flp
LAPRTSRSPPPGNDAACGANLIDAEGDQNQLGYAARQTLGSSLRPRQEGSRWQCSSPQKNLAAGEEGTSFIKYSLLVALLASAGIAVLNGLGQEVGYIFSACNTSVSYANFLIRSAS